jgi:regulator of nonsense transcripts 3
VKHANHAQGVTEALLKDALAAFGSVTAVEIDRKKGFAYVDFADPGSLAKAMAASPVTVALATVQVLERKEMGKKGGASGSGTQGQGQGQVKGAAPSVQVPAHVEQKDSAPPTASVATTPTAEKAEKAGGEQQQSKRGGRRRGGRGRDRDSKEAKDSAGGGKDGSAKKGDGGGASAAVSAS